MVFKNLHIPVLWTKVASALEGLNGFQKSLHPCALDESSLSIRRVYSKYSSSVVVFLKVALCYILHVSGGQGFLGWSEEERRAQRHVIIRMTRDTHTIHNKHTQNICEWRVN